jgi:putative sigma-54 modulation protein
MKLQMHSIHFDADRKLLDYIQKKAEKLETFYDRITGGEVFLRINKDTVHHANKVLEIKLNVPGSTLFVKETSSSFEAAADEAVDALKTQLKKFKEKNGNGH